MLMNTSQTRVTPGKGKTSAYPANVCGTWNEHVKKHY